MSFHLPTKRTQNKLLRVVNILYPVTYYDEQHSSSNVTYYGSSSNQHSTAHLFSGSASMSSGLMDTVPGGESDQ